MGASLSSRAMIAAEGMRSKRIGSVVQSVNRKLWIKIPTISARTAEAMTAMARSRKESFLFMFLSFLPETQALLA